MKKYSYLYEIPILYVFIHLFNYFFVPEFPAFVGMSPHPYWIGILLFGFRYGIFAGFLSGLTSAVLFLTLTWFFGERYLFEDVIFFAEPSLFMIVGAIVGTGIRRYRDTIQNLLNDKAKFSAHEKSFTEEIKTQQGIISELEKRIVTRMSTLITLYEGARKLESVHVDELYRGILKFISKMLEADQAALYLRKGDVFELFENYGWKENSSWPTAVIPGQGISGIAASQKEVITVRDFLAGSDKDEIRRQLVIRDCLMAGAIREGEKGEVIGVLSIQSMPFLNFNSANINLFSFLLGWANRSLGRIAYIQNLKTHEIIDPEFGVYSHNYLKSRSDEEFSRSQTYFLPLSVGLARLCGIHSLPPEKRKVVLMAVGQIIKESCRKMDVVACYPDPDIPFAMLMITASATQAGELRKKIKERFQLLEFGSHITLNVGLSSFSPQTKDFESLLTAAREDTFHG